MFVRGLQKENSYRSNQPYEYAYETNQSIIQVRIQVGIRVSNQSITQNIRIAQVLRKFKYDVDCK
jgi:hypothetical protein